MIQLNQNNIEHISKHIPCPTYNRYELTTGIVHIGVGGFHRSHQAYYIHQLLEKYNILEWGICGVGLREADRKMFNTLKKQDGLYTLIIQNPDGTMKCEVIGAMKEMLLAVDNPNLVVDKLAHPETKIVSLTITEGGYNFNPQTGDFNFDHVDIQHELIHRDEPKTVFGYLTAALRRRRATGVPPFSILSCDNILHNGDVAHQMLCSFVKEQDPELTQWIDQEVAFPNTMVDRITPVTSPVDLRYLQNKYHLKDEWPVICEPFIQWVIEDCFSNTRPPLERLGVQFVSDVAPFEKIKIRLLNAGHSVLGIPGAIHEHPTIYDCMNDSVFAKFMRQFMDEEVTPVLDPVTGVDIERYKDSLEERFRNPNIKDSVSRICSESSAKLPKFLIPTIQDNLSAGGSIKYATFILAAWCYYSDIGVTENYEPLNIIDDNKVKLHRVASLTSENPLAFLKLKEIFGNLSDSERFTKKYKEMIQLIYKGEGIRRLMSEMI